MDMKNVQGAVKKLNESGEGTLIFGTFNKIDRDGDVLLPGSISEQIAPIMPAHDWDQAPIGKAKIYETDSEARADFWLNETKLGKDWLSAIRFDVEHMAPPLMQYSFGYSADEFSFGEQDGQRVRFLKRVTVHEVSPVLLGAGVGTRTVELNGARATPGKPFDPVRVEKTLQRSQTFLLADSFRNLESKFEALTLKHYREIDAVEDRLFDVVHSLARMAAKELGIFEPKEITFFREARYGERADFNHRLDLSGLAHQKERHLWLRHGLGGSDLIHVVAHEMRHLTQAEATDQESREANEQDADRYAKTFTSRFGFIPSWASLYVHGGEKRLDESHQDAPRGSWLIHQGNGFLYRRDSYGWQKHKSWRN